MSRVRAGRGVVSRFVNGCLVITPEVIDAVRKVFAGSGNAELVPTFRAAGARPVGLSGLDAGLVDAELLDPELGQVGKPVRSDARLLDLLTDAAYLPVVACVAGDDRGNVFNENAAQMAVAVSASCGAESRVFRAVFEWRRAAPGRPGSSAPGTAPWRATPCGR